MYYGSNDCASGLILKNFFVIKGAPSVFENHIRGRYSSALLHILHGDYHFFVKDTDTCATEGDTLYLPKGGHYRYNILSSDALFILVNFDLAEMTENETKDIVFSDVPAVISSRIEEAYKFFNEIASLYHTDRLTATCLLYRLIADCKGFFTNEEAKINEKRIAPALKHIEEHYTQAIGVDDLALLCKISTPHFRRLFKDVMGTTPIKYKNRLLMKAACNLLVNDGLNVSETAYALNFDDIYTFSQLFKKEMGVSPKKYQRDLSKKQ